jgi:hypothetical protein
VLSRLLAEALVHLLPELQEVEVEVVNSSLLLVLSPPLSAVQVLTLQLLPVLQLAQCLVNQSTFGATVVGGGNTGSAFGSSSIFRHQRLRHSVLLPTSVFGQPASTTTTLAFGQLLMLPVFGLPSSSSSFSNTNPNTTSAFSNLLRRRQ